LRRAPAVVGIAFAVGRAFLVDTQVERSGILAHLLAAAAFAPQIEHSVVGSAHFPILRYQSP